MWRRPIRCRSCVTIFSTASAASTSCAGGLIPYWAKDIKIGFSTINARAEEIDIKPAFREAFCQRRCLVPLDSFYEWAKTPTGKQPYAIALKDGGLMAMAGLWVTWRSPEGERIRSFTIATTTPNELCAKLHNRMPVVLKPEAWPMWLGEEPADPAHLKALLAPYPSEDMICWPVSARVGNVRNNDPSLSRLLCSRACLSLTREEQDGLYSPVSCFP
jgi:putative SOS response-associated peptidase YedK